MLTCMVSGKLLLHQLGRPTTKLKTHSWLPEINVNIIGLQKRGHSYGTKSVPALTRPSLGQQLRKVVNFVEFC